MSSVSVHKFCSHGIMSHNCQDFWIMSVQSQLVRWCYEPSQPKRITSGLKTNFNLSPAYSFQKSLFHKSLLLKSQLKFSPRKANPEKQQHMPWSLLKFRGHSTLEPALSRATYFILQTYTATGLSHKQHGKNSGDVLEKMQVNRSEGQKLARKKSLAVSVACMAIY